MGAQNELPVKCTDQNVWINDEKCSLSCDQSRQTTNCGPICR